jgi:hypothetical protein
VSRSNSRHIQIKNVFYMVLTVLGACVVALILGEGLIRIAVPQNLETPLSIFMPDSSIGYRIRPNVSGEFRQIENSIHIRTNSLGLRGAEIPKKRPGEFRVMGLGDSFGFGSSVLEDEGMFARCQEYLNSSGGYRYYTVINAAIPGYGVAQEYALCRDLIPVVHPDMLLVAIFVGNDFFDSDPDRLSRMTAQDGMIVLKDDDDPDSPKLIAPFRPVLIWLHGHSQLFRFLRKQLNARIARFGLNLVEDPDIYWESYPPQSRFIRGTKALFSAMADFVALARDRSLVLVFAVIPTVNQVRSDRWKTYIHRHGNEASRLIRSRPEARIGAFLDSLHVPNLDLLTDFISADADTPIYYQVDPHLNARGYDLAGRMLSDYISRVIADQPATSNP